MMRNYVLELTLQQKSVICVEFNNDVSRGKREWEDLYLFAE